VEAQNSSAEPRPVSRYNHLSVAVSFALTGLVVFYLPSLTGRPFDWKVEGHLIGAAIATIGMAFILAACKDLTDRESFVAWSLAVLAGAIAYALIAITRDLSLPGWLAGVLLAAAVMLIFIAVYALVIGLADVFDRAAATQRLRVPLPGIRSTQTEVDGSATAPRRLSWYERITLTVAVVSTLATLVGTAVSFIHA
jgi:hypothetical protein